MKKLLLACLWLIACCTTIQAQHHFRNMVNFSDIIITKVNGCVKMKESETQRIAPVMRAGVRIFCLADSTYKNSTVTDSIGNFSINAFQNRNDKYEIHISYLGTETYKQSLIRSNIMKMGTIMLKEKPITMEEAVIVAKLKKMHILGDTTIFNTEAFKVSEGAVLLELVRKMPGLRITKGKMTYQGKNISEIMLNGEKFFSNDISIALQNMPVNLLKEVRIYDKKSELAEMTGVDDGKRKTVMDLKTKKSINNGLMANISAGVGDQDLYGANGMLNYFETGGNHASVFGNRHNTPNDLDMMDWGGSTIIGGFSNGGGNPAKQLEQRVGGSFNKKTKEITIGGDISYNDNNTDRKNYTISENYLPTGNTFSDNSSLSSSGNSNTNASFNISNNFNNKFNISGNFSYNKSQGNNINENKQALFNKNPYRHTTNPIEQEDAIPMKERINRIENKNLGNNSLNSFTGMLMMTYQFSEKSRRNIHLTTNTNINDSKSNMFQQSYTRYYQLGDSLLYQNRFSSSPSRSNTYRISVGYDEPISKHINLGIEYEFNTQKNKQNEDVFDLSRLLSSSPDSPLGTLPEGYRNEQIDSLSNINNTRTTSHLLSAKFNYSKNNLFLNASFTITPEAQNIYMLNEENVTDTTFHRVNYNIQVMTSYFKNKTSINLHYYGASQAPAVSMLLPKTNNDNPLYITTGNPNLKSSFSHNINANVRINQLWANMNFSQSFNDVINKNDYDPVSGVYTNRPENINGNWDISATIGYSKDWERFSIEAESKYNFSKRVNYISIDNENHKDAIKSHNYSQLLKAVYTPDWAELAISGNLEWEKAKDKLQKESNLSTRLFSILAETTFFLPWNIRLYSSFSCITRNGFLSEQMNHSELLWNANISYSFLKKKQATIKLEIYDILQRATNFMAYTNNMGSVQSRSEGVNSYFLASFKYRFNLFKAKKNKENG